MDEGHRLLAITAHPDDLELSCAGTVVAWLRRGWQARLLLCTSGDKGSADRAVTPEQVAAWREAEQAAAAREMGLQDIVYLRHPDSELAANSGLRQELCHQIRLYRPHAIFTHDPWRPYQLHPDHRAVGMAVVDAVAAARGQHCFPEQLVGEVATWRVPEIYLFATAWPDTFVDVSETFDVKIRALQKHVSQMAGMPGMEDRLREMAQEYGKRIGCRYAEAFKLMRVTIYPDL